MADEIRFSGFHFSMNDDRKKSGRFEGKTLNDMAVHLLHMGPGDGVIMLAESWDSVEPMLPMRIEGVEWHTPDVKCNSAFTGHPHWHGERPE